MDIEKLQITSWDERRDLLLPGDHSSTLDASVRHFTAIAEQSIQERGKFCVALSGGSTPKAIYNFLSQDPYRSQIDWTKVYLFWGDERSVPPSSEQNNYKMAMDNGLASLSIPASQIFRMKGEDSIEENALRYEKLLQIHLPQEKFDLVMLGMGEDGHTASLFPQTEGLKATNRLVIANYIPQKNTWRMTLTFEAINASRNIAIYVLGSNKQKPLYQVLTSPLQIERYPIQNIGTNQNRALWIIDDEANSDEFKNA